MDERDRYRLLRALTGHDPEPESDIAYALSEDVRAAWEAAVRTIAGMMEARLVAILSAWGYAEEDAANAADLHIHTADDIDGARVAHVVTITEHARAAERRAARFVAGYALVMKGGALAFDVQITDTEHGRALEVPASALKGAQA